jgi:hypothetical protein
MFYLQGSSSQAPNQYIDFILCEKFGWTFEELYSQPRGFIEEMITVMGIVNKVRNKRLRDNK